MVRTSSEWCEVGDVGGGGLCGFIEVSPGDKGCGMSRQREKNRRRRGGSPEKEQGHINHLVRGGNFMLLRE